MPLAAAWNSLVSKKGVRTECGVLVLFNEVSKMCLCAQDTLFRSQIPQSLLFQVLQRKRNSPAASVENWGLFTPDGEVSFHHPSTGVLDLCGKGRAPLLSSQDKGSPLLKGLGCSRPLPPP